MLRGHLEDLHLHILKAILDANKARREQLSQVAYQTSADTIYQIDSVSDAALLNWFKAEWPSTRPVEIVMEGLRDDETLNFPEDTPVSETKLRCIIACGRCRDGLAGFRLRKGKT